jgi:hypothetical protein
MFVLPSPPISHPTTPNHKPPSLVLDGNVSSVLSLLLGRLLGVSEQGSRASTRRVYLARLSVSLLCILDATALLQYSRMNNEYI